MNDLIDRQEAIDALINEAERDGAYGYIDREDITKVLNSLPPASPDKEKISFCLYAIKLLISPRTSAENVAAIDHYIAEVYKAATGEEGPEWMI